MTVLFYFIGALFRKKDGKKTLKIIVFISSLYDLQIFIKYFFVFFMLIGRDNLNAA